MHAFKQLRIGARLALGFGAALLVALTGSVMGIFLLNQAASDTDEFVSKDVEQVRVAQNWLAGVEANSLRTQLLLTSPDASRAAAIKKDMDATSAGLTDMQKKVEALVGSDEGKSLLKDIAEQRAKYRAAREEVAKRKLAGENIGAVLDEKLLPMATAYRNALLNLVDFSARELAVSEEALTRQEHRARDILLFAGVLSLVVGALLGTITVASIRAPINTATLAARRIAEGDLSARIDASGKDELAEMLGSIAHMQESLRTVVSQVRHGTQEVTTASAEIAKGNQDLSSRTEQQASNLEQTAASMLQMTQTVRATADSARDASELVVGASTAASRGGDVVGQVVQTMGEISASSRKIADIIGVIDGIAFQTNILALNAAVEAARAGEQGRGFAVVAAEVRTLAQRSAQAAKEIKGLIDESVSRVEAGGKQVNDAGSAMEDIVKSVAAVNEIINRIAQTSSEQSSGIDQVNSAVGHLDQMTQQNAALVEQSAAAATSLKDQARQLAQAVAGFRVDGGAVFAAALQAPSKPIAPSRVVARPAPAVRPVAKPTAARLAATVASSATKSATAVVKATASSAAAPKSAATKPAPAASIVSKPAVSKPVASRTVASATAPAVTVKAPATLPPVSRPAPVTRAKVSSVAADDDWEEF
jgi:methyl-accepting chemotaxis protein